MPPKSGRDPKDKHWTVASDVQLLSRMHRTQAVIYRGEQSAMERQLRTKRKIDPDREMTDSESEKLNRINTFLSKSTQAILDLDQARERIRASADTDVLLAQLKHEFIAAARTYTEDEWKIIDRVRNEKRPGRWVTTDPVKEKP